jgi:hypothetical protein
MVERVDAGPIVGVELFTIPARSTVSDLEALAYARLAQLFWQLAKPLATRDEPLPELPVAWSGQKTTRRDFATLCGTHPDISKDELSFRVA